MDQLEYVSFFELFRKHIVRPVFMAELLKDAGYFLLLSFGERVSVVLGLAEDQEGVEDLAGVGGQEGLGDRPGVGALPGGMPDAVAVCRIAERDHSALSLNSDGVI